MISGGISVAETPPNVPLEGGAVNMGRMLSTWPSCPAPVLVHNDFVQGNND